MRHVLQKEKASGVATTGDFCSRSCKPLNYHCFKSKKATAALLQSGITEREECEFLAHFVTQLIARIHQIEGEKP